MTRLIVLVAVLCCALVTARAEGPDEQYVRIYQTIQDADRLNGLGQSRAAAAKYVEAQQGLMKFRGIFPGWNDRVINYRLNYVATKLAPLSSMIAAPSTTPTVPPSSATSIPTSTPPPANSVVSTAPSTTPPMSAEYENQLKALQNEIERLQNETRVLAAKLKEALSVQPAGVDPREMAKANDTIRNLQKENELQKAQLAQRSAPPPVPSELTAKLNEQSELIANLRAENDVLKKQSTDWKQKYDALAAAPRPPMTGQPDPVQLATIQKLSADNLGLRKEVELWKQVATRKTPPPAEKVSVMPPEAQRELEALRARLQVFEAKPVPFTAEELALFYKPEPVLVAPNNAAPSVAAPNSAPLAVSPHGAEMPTRKVVVSRGVPAGAGPLLRAAEQAFATMHYAEAERQYLEVLHQDENNVTTLGNLASAQLELGSIADAEATTKRALVLDPDDYFTLYVLGRIRFRQDRLDEALDALSRSAKANPNYADTQNYLGIVLSEKGQRGPAEAALRKAIQLQPDNAVAHNNLAVVYATQKPPALALAKWHYQKAIASGHPKNSELERMLEQKQ